MDIHAWLETFRNAWVQHDIDAVMALFTDDVEYWETPFVRVGSMEALRGEWAGVLGQRDIRLETDVYSRDGDRYAVLWRLSYSNAGGEHRQLAGTYLITLGPDGRCSYFHHTGELKPDGV